jgi:hypothetical protein
MHSLSCANKLPAGGTGRRTMITAVCAATLLLAGCNKKQAQPPGTLAQPGPTQYVHLIWKQSTNNWKVKLNNDPTEKDPATAKTILPKGTQPTMFVVDIQGHTTATFKNPGGLSVWEGANAKSQPQSGINSAQILGPSINKQKKMIFFDLNQGGPVTLNYELHFNGTVPSVDPIVDNGGGSDD